MRVINRWRAAVDDYRAACFAETGRAPGALGSALGAAGQLAAALAARVRCALVGHQLVDDDPGDPEVGPRPRVYCARCGSAS